LWKTTFIKENANLEQDLILTPGKVNCQEFISSGYEAQTVDSLVINGYVGHPVSIVWVDEALLEHPGVIESIRRKLRPV
jgi:hypothetical protein